MPMIDIFGDDAFSVASLTAAIQVVPNTYSKVRSLNLFSPTPSPTTTVLVERENGVLNLLNTAPRGSGKGTVGQSPKRDIRSFIIPHIPHEEAIYADDVQNVRRFGTEGELAGLQDLVNKKLVSAARKHDITEEHLMVSALRGQVMDADGTILLNLFTEFGITEHSQAFAFSNASAEISETIVGEKRYLETSLKGETMNGVMYLCSPGFFDELIKHPSIKDAYKWYASTQEPLREDVRNRFVHKGVVFEEYVGEATYLNADGTTTTRKFIPDDEARGFPLGTMETFKWVYGPSDYLTDANMAPQMRYAKLIADPGDRFVNVETQQNPLPLVLRPELLLRATIS